MGDITEGYIMAGQSSCGEDADWKGLGGRLPLSGGNI